MYFDAVVKLLAIGGQFAAIYYGLRAVSWQIKKQHENTLFAQQEQHKHTLEAQRVAAENQARLEIYRAIAAALEPIEASIARTVALVVGVAPAVKYATALTTADELSEAFVETSSKLIAISSVAGRWHAVVPELGAMKREVDKKIDEFQKSYIGFHARAAKYLASDKREPLTEAGYEELEVFALRCRDTALGISCVVEDLRSRAQRALLTGLFG